MAPWVPPERQAGSSSLDTAVVEVRYSGTFNVSDCFFLANPFPPSGPDTLTASIVSGTGICDITGFPVGTAFQVTPQDDSPAIGSDNDGLLATTDVNMEFGGTPTFAITPPFGPVPAGFTAPDRVAEYSFLFIPPSGG
jgi:hypothetical protein